MPWFPSLFDSWSRASSSQRAQTHPSGTTATSSSAKGSSTAHLEDPTALPSPLELTCFPPFGSAPNPHGKAEFLRAAIAEQSGTPGQVVQAGEDIRRVNDEALRLARADKARSNTIATSSLRAILARQHHGLPHAHHQQQKQPKPPRQLSSQKRKKTRQQQHQQQTPHPPPSPSSSHRAVSLPVASQHQQHHGAQQSMSRRNASSPMPIEEGAAAAAVHPPKSPRRPPRVLLRRQISGFRRPSGQQALALQRLAAQRDPRLRPLGPMAAGIIF